MTHLSRISIVTRIVALIVATTVAVNVLLLVYFSQDAQRGSIAHPATALRANPIAYFSVGPDSQVSSAFPVTFGPGGHILATGSTDRTVVLWDVGPLLAATNVLPGLPELNFRRDALAILRGLTAPVSTVAFSPDGRILTTGSADKDKTVVDAAVVLGDFVAR